MLISKNLFSFIGPEYVERGYGGALCLKGQDSTIAFRNRIQHDFAAFVLTFVRVSSAELTRLLY